MKYQELLKAVKTAQDQTRWDGIPSYFSRCRSTGTMELSYPYTVLPDNDVTFKQLCKLEKAGLVEFSSMDETVYIKEV